MSPRWCCRMFALLLFFCYVLHTLFGVCSCVTHLYCWFEWLQCLTNTFLWKCQQKLNKIRLDLFQSCCVRVVPTHILYLVCPVMYMAAQVYLATILAFYTYFLIHVREKLRCYCRCIKKNCSCFCSLSSND